MPCNHLFFSRPSCVEQDSTARHRRNHSQPARSSRKAGRFRDFQSQQAASPPDVRELKVVVVTLLLRCRGSITSLLLSLAFFVLRLEGVGVCVAGDGALEALCRVMMRDMDT